MQSLLDQHPAYPHLRKRREGLRAILARALPRHIPTVDADVHYVVINLRPRRSIDAYISISASPDTELH